MAAYCVNRNAQSNGDHEVHNLQGGCIRLPELENQIPLGQHVSCQTAVAAAKHHFSQVNGCYYCALPCHTQ